MAIPDYETVMLPLLKVAGEREELTVRDAIEELAERFGLSEEEREELLPSGRQRRFDNRVSWARTYMKEAGLLEATGRGRFRITALGREVLAQKPERIDQGFLRRFPAFVEFQIRKSRRRDGTLGAETALATGASSETVAPEEAIAEAFERHRSALESELLDYLKRASPAFFEQVVLDVLVAMGYGGSWEDAAQVVGRSGDGGIDGVIKQDPLGLDVVYVQAKRWTDQSIGRPHLQQFAGALRGRGASKGVFITTGKFTADVVEYANGNPDRIVLIDGRELARLMVLHGVGVTTTRRYELKRVDSDYFAEGS